MGLAARPRAVRRRRGGRLLLAAGAIRSLLLQQGARPRDLWGINLYPDRPPAELVEFDSMVDVRPAQGNRSRGVDDAQVRRRIQDIVAKAGRFLAFAVAARSRR
ncbi:MAG TPA: DUF5674 family protein [Methylomirabilota bacterium]|nr:DUF5674 family protein [Methylomirabilota bacterium]